LSNLTITIDHPEFFIPPAMNNTTPSSSDIQIHGGPDLTNEIMFSQPTIAVFSGSYSSIYKGNYRGEAVSMSELIEGSKLTVRLLRIISGGNQGPQGSFTFLGSDE
jgi:hypothetical protein